MPGTFTDRRRGTTGIQKYNVEYTAKFRTVNGRATAFYIPEPVKFFVLSACLPSAVSFRRAGFPGIGFGKISTAFSISKPVGSLANTAHTTARFADRRNNRSFRGVLKSVHLAVVIRTRSAVMAVEQDDRSHPRFFRRAENGGQSGRHGARWNERRPKGIAWCSGSSSGPSRTASSAPGSHAGEKDGQYGKRTGKVSYGK